MQSKDQLEQHINTSRRVCSSADNGNLLQNAATARMNQIGDQCERNGSFPTTWDEQGWRTREQFSDHFRMPGGMTFRRGSILPEDR